MTFSTSGCLPNTSPFTEMKLIVLSLIARSTPTLLEGKFEVSDPLNTVRVLIFC